MLKTILYVDKVQMYEEIMMNNDNDNLESSLPTSSLL